MFADIAKNLDYQFETFEPLKSLIEEKARQEGFSVAIRSSTPGVRFYLKCIHGGEYRTKRGIPEDTRKRKKSVIQCGCKWALLAAFSKKSQRWGVRYVKGHSEEAEHNHPMEAHPPMPRRVQRKIQQPNQSCQIPPTINPIMPGSIHNVSMTPLNITGPAEMSLKQPCTFGTCYCMENKQQALADAIAFLFSRNFIVRYETVPIERDTPSVFFAHPSSTEKAIRFPEVVLVDTNYRNVSDSLPLINFIGVTNLGSTRLQSYVIASALVAGDENGAFRWILRQLRDCVFTKTLPTVFIVQDNNDLMDSIKEAFPESKQSFCLGHLQKEFTRCASGHLSTKMDGALKSMFFARNEKQFWLSVDQCRSAMKRTLKADELCNLLEKQLARRVFWGGPWAETLPHMGYRTTQSIEGTHAAIKNILSRHLGLLGSIKAIEPYIASSMIDEQRLFAVKCLDTPISIQEHPIPLSSILNHVSFFAITSIKSELTIASWFAPKDMSQIDCDCPLRVNFLLPCRHTLHLSLPIPLMVIHPRWRVLSSEDIPFCMTSNQNLTF